MNIIDFLFGFPVSGCNVTAGTCYVLVFCGCKWEFLPYDQQTCVTTPVIYDPLNSTLYLNQGTPCETSVVISGGGGPTPIVIPQLRVFANQPNRSTGGTGISYSFVTQTGDGTDDFLNYEPRVYLFKRRRYKGAGRRGSSGGYKVSKPRGFCMSASPSLNDPYSGYFDQMGRIVVWDLDPNARCTVNNFNTVWAGSPVGGEHKKLFMTQADLTQWFHTLQSYPPASGPGSLPNDPTNNPNGSVSTPTGGHKKSKAQYFKFAIMIRVNNKYILGPLSETIRVNYIHSDSRGPESQFLSINTV